MSIQKIILICYTMGMSKKIIDKIEYALSRDCTKQEQIVLEFLHDNAKDIPNLTAKIVAQECYCSTSAVNRAVKKLDLEGFTELKKFEKFNRSSELTPIKSQDKFNTFINNILNDINYDDIKKMVNYINTAEKIFVYGNGVSNISSLFLFRQLLNLEYNVTYLPDLDLLPKVKNGIIITVSNTGTNPIVNDMIKRNVSVPVFGITKKNSPLDQCLDFAITHDIDMSNVNELEREQQIQILLLIDILIDNIYTENVYNSN